MCCNLYSGLLAESSSGEAPYNIYAVTSGGQINSLKQKKPSKLIYFDCKLNANMFLCALKKDFMKVGFKNSIRRLSLLYHLPDIKIALINP